jgi:hypothetical protein
MMPSTTVKTAAPPAELKSACWPSAELSGGLGLSSRPSSPIVRLTNSAVSAEGDVPDFLAA